MSHWLYVILRRHGVPPVDSWAPFTVREGRRFPANRRAGSAGSFVGSARQQTRRNDPRSRSRSRQTTQPPDVGEKIGKTERRVNKPTGTPLWSCNVRHHKTLAVLNPLNSDDNVSFYLLTSDSNAKLYVCIYMYIYMNLQMYLCTHTHTHVRAKHFLSFPQFFPISCSCFVSVVPILQQPPW